MKGKKVLVIDSDLDTQEIVRQTFTKMGARVIIAGNGRQGLSLLYRHHPDLVILDIMLPGLDGWRLCRQIRLFTDVPIIVLTAVHSQQLEVRSLDAGATDFINKPFNIRILLARARAAIRKVRQTGALKQQPIYKDSYLHIDVPNRHISVQGETVKLTSVELRLLGYLISHAGRAVTRQQILKNIWPDRVQDSIANVHVFISRLRGKLEKNPRQPEYLHTVRGLGYLFKPKKRDHTSS